MTKASVKQIGTRRVTKVVEVDVPVEEITLTMTKREAAYVYMILGKVSNNKREWHGGHYHPVYESLNILFRADCKVNTGDSRFDYGTLPLEAQDWVASQ